MAVPRLGPVTPARAAPRKLEGRTTQLEAGASSKPCLEPPALPESSSRHCLEHQPRLEALPRAAGPRTTHALPRAPARGPAARGRCLELGWFAGSARGSRQRTSSR
ncbi:hypothetical protein Salat_2825700 [Sesamum alatum]|uniref:Uncharacterized protein n=1 Tax=Sesamum alatum TaxID=300844 RepID=A0AAE1XLR2_9LAMI|nr:hypothetical protein Salat_2825700 [Sesamum alatum]